MGKVETENANNPHGYGFIDPHHFAPFPKNPLIARFFMQLGRVDELGSGVLNVHRFIKAYSSNDQPQFFEGPIFKMMIPTPEAPSYIFPSESNDVIEENLIDGAIDGAIDGITQPLKTKLRLLLKIITLNEGKRAPDYKQIIRVSDKSIERYLHHLKAAGLIEFKGESTQTGGYYLTRSLKSKLWPSN
ncbi:MAG: hypothetical protein R3C61_18380 [Bacteroidia bacterium]